MFSINYKAPFAKYKGKSSYILSFYSAKVWENERISSVEITAPQEKVFTLCCSRSIRASMWKIRPSDLTRRILSRPALNLIIVCYDWYGLRIASQLSNQSQLLRGSYWSVLSQEAGLVNSGRRPLFLKRASDVRRSDLNFICCFCLLRSMDI